jgi:hypothetical protein
VSPRRPRRRLIVPLFDVVADGGAPVHLEVLRADPGHLEGVTDGVAADLETPRIPRLVRRTVVHHWKKAVTSLRTINIETIITHKTVICLL